MQKTRNRPSIHILSILHFWHYPMVFFYSDKVIRGQTNTTAVFRNYLFAKFVVALELSDFFGIHVSYYLKICSLFCSSSFIQNLQDFIKIRYFFEKNYLKINRTWKIYAISLDKISPDITLPCSNKERIYQEELLCDAISKTLLEKSGPNEKIVRLHLFLRSFWGYFNRLERLF